MAKLSAAGQRICDDVLSLVKERIPGERGDAMQGFITQYLAGISDEDLVQFRTADLYGAAVAHWNFLHLRIPGTTRVRVYNPRHDDHGWQSTHTIVELACDDMPFLVDSVRMAMDRLDLTVHLLIHPVMQIRRSESGHALEAVTSPGDDTVTEAVMHFEVDRQIDAEHLARIEQEVESVLSDVRSAVEDWKPMCARLEETLSELSVPRSDSTRRSSTRMWRSCAGSLTTISPSLATKRWIWFVMGVRWK